MREKIIAEGIVEIDKDKAQIVENIKRTEDLISNIDNIIVSAKEEVLKYEEALKTFKNSADKAQKEKLLEMSKSALDLLEGFRDPLIQQKLEYEKIIAELESIDGKLGDILSDGKKNNN